MSGIVGIWNLDGKRVEREVLARMSATLAHRGPDGEEIWIDGAVGLSCQLFRVSPESEKETQPLVGSSGVALVFDGRLDNREELLARLRDSYWVSSSSPDPDLVLAAYEAFGDRFPEQLVGDFALGLFDPNRRQLLLTRDAIGIRPLYYYRKWDMLLFASEIKALLTHPDVSSQPNDDYLAQYLLGRHQETGEMTFFGDVWSLLPAHAAMCTLGRFITWRYWDFDATTPVHLGSFNEYAEAFRHHFDQAVERRMRSMYPVAVSLSGGLDSSSIFCLAETLSRRNPDRYPRIVGVSYTSPAGSPSDEAAFLTEIERQYRLTISRVPIVRRGPLKDSRQAVRHVEAPLLDEMWPTMQAFHTTVHREGARVLLTGHWADQLLFDQAYLVDRFYDLAWGEIIAHLREFGRWFTDSDARYFRHRFFIDLIKYSLPGPLVSLIRSLRIKRGRSWYAQGLRRRIRRYPFGSRPLGNGFVTAHAHALYEQATSSRHVLCMEWENKVAAMHGLETTFPFLDRDLLSFLMRIPGQMQTWQGVPKAILREGLNGVLPDAIACRAWKADFTYLANEGVERDYPELSRCLPSDKTMAVRMGYLNRDILIEQLDKIKDKLRGDTCDTAWSLSDLVGLELWLQVFFGEDDNGQRGEQSPKTVATAQGGTR
ncbi:MAG: asparagine synthase-related protein [Candidatus Methylomirabilales bacterium]